LAWAGDSTSPSEEERAFLQRRVAAFGLVTAGLFFFFLGYRTLAILLRLGESGLSDPSYVYHALAGGCFLAVWLCCRSGRRSVRFVRCAEVLGLLTGVVAIALMGSAIPALERPDFTLLLALTHVLMARALFVPSSARRSLVLALAVGVEFVVCVYGTFAKPDVFTTIMKTGAWPDLVSASDLATRVAIYSATWWVLTAFITTAASKVIYGLRRDARDAKHLGQYRLEAKLGEGGMGIVYRARHALLQRPTAVKLLHPDRSGGASLKHFEREVQQTARLSHPNIVTIFDYGHTPEGVFYYAMEFLDGVTLDAAVTRLGPMPGGRVLAILKQMAGALVEAHGMGLIHRDIKPANVILLSPRAHAGARDTIKVLDFGLVKQLRQDGAVDLSSADTIIGTPQYLAPEAIRDPRRVDGRTDLYALGAVGYFLVTGTHVFTAQTVVEMCSHHLHTPPQPPSERLGSPVQGELERLLLSCLAKDPAARPASAAELEARLSACPDPEPWSPENTREWWLRLEALPRRAPEGVPSGTALTIDVRRHEHGPLSAP
jgi:eukaryotic-like serine/threonine-protein kinase